MELTQERSGLEKRFYELCHKVVEQESLELYDLNYITGNSTLRVFIRDPKTDTAVIEDCMKIDRALTPFMEEEWVPEDLVLEVSSPGVFRDLKSKDHFDLVIGKRVNLKLFNQQADQIKELKGQKQILAVLKATTEKYLTINFNDKDIDLDFAAIKKANLEPEV